MTTDNRTNEPNKYAGFVARQNHQRDPWRGIGKKCLCGVVFDSDVDHAMHQVEAILEAALVAAQGAAPQAESDVQESPVIENRGAEISTPVQPSSTVDEARAWDEGYWQGINGHTGPGNPYRTDESTTPRAVVEAIGGESRAHD